MPTLAVFAAITDIEGRILCVRMNYATRALCSPRDVNILLCSAYGRISMAHGPHAGKVSGGAMAAYAIVNVEITDSAGFAEYRKLVPASIAEFGGRFLTRGGVTEVLEGEWIPNRLVILEFPDVATVKAWYHSPEYQKLAELRKRTANSDFVVIEGV